MFKKKLLVVDLETTGLDPNSDSIIQIGACLLSRKVLREEQCMTTLVQPTSPISRESQAIHGLTPEDLDNAPTLANAIRKLEDLAPPSKVFLCGHNISFDTAFLKAAYRQLDREYPYDYHTVDLWSVANFVFSANGLNPPNYRLDTLAGLYNIGRDRHHDALQDVQITAKVFKHLYQSAREAGVDLSGQHKLPLKDE